MTKHYVIWWTNQTDCELLQAVCETEQGGGAQFEGRAVPEEWPDWLKAEWASRWGRNGRGRIWNTHAGALPNGVDFSETTPFAELIGGSDLMGRHSAAGIVVPLEDLHHVIGLPGFVTNDTLSRLCIHGVDLDL